ncbi:hypothetical protein ACJ41O_000926 [Fusarium nematophilum]
MPRPHGSIPDFLPPLHLYRHLLRESSYLPPAWRSSITSAIRTRFHNHRRSDPLEKKRRAKANNVLRSLRAANSGDRAAMNGLIQKGFARYGPRRRNIITSFVRAQGPSDSDALEALIDEAAAKSSPSKARGLASEPPNATPKRNASSPDKPTGKSAGTESGEDAQATAATTRRRSVPDLTRNDFYHKWDLPKLTQLLQSQRTRQDADLNWPSRKIKNLKLDNVIPKVNIWGKPLAKNVIQTKTASFWRRTAEKMVVPLHTGEWDLLGRLSEGAQETGEWKVPERRPAAKPVRPTDSGQSATGWKWETHASKTMAEVERKWATRVILRSEEKAKLPYESRRKQRDLTPRWYRRAYRRAWWITPKMDQDPHSLKYTVTWGPLNAGLVPASDAQLHIFEGVDRKGQKVKPPARS